MRCSYKARCTSHARPSYLHLAFVPSFTSRSVSDAQILATHLNLLFKTSGPHRTYTFLRHKNAPSPTFLAFTKMSQMDEIWSNDEIRNPEAEPLPFIDYNLIQRIISISASRLEKRELDGFTSLLEARKLYYDAHNIFWLVHNGLQDAKGYEMWQMAEMKKLDNMNEDQDAELWEKLKLLKNNIRKNHTTIITHLEQVRLRWQKCSNATAEFGRKKTEFAETNWPLFRQASEQPEVKAILISSSGL